jgi:hypothetical protein
MLETSALNKLLQRNMIKKYKYSVKMVEELLRIVTRNLQESHELLC